VRKSVGENVIFLQITFEEVRGVTIEYHLRSDD
jgi:hypothetical protein